MSKVKVRQSFEEAQLCFLNDDGLVHDFFRQHSAEWSLEEIDNLRYNLLHDSLRVLLDRRASEKLVTEVLDWVNRDDISPFSFRVCAECESCDYNTLRESLLILYKKQKAMVH